MQRWDGVCGGQLASGGDDVVALLAIALDLDPAVLVPILDHDHQPGPALGKVVGSHALATLVTLALVGCKKRKKK